MQPGSFSLLTMYSIRQGAHKTFTRFSYSSIISPVSCEASCRMPTVGRRPDPEAEPGIEKKLTVVPVIGRDMGMSVNDGVRFGKFPADPFFQAQGRSPAVHDPDSKALQMEGLFMRQFLPEGNLVHVPLHRLQGQGLGSGTPLFPPCPRHGSGDPHPGNIPLRFSPGPG